MIIAAKGVILYTYIEICNFINLKRITMKFIVATIAALFAVTAMAQTPAPKAETKPAAPAPAATPAPAAPAKTEEAKKCDPKKDKDCKAEPAKK